jgi:hypothetical protein
MEAPQEAQPAVVKGLNTYIDPIHAIVQKSRQGIKGYRVRVDLYGHFHILSESESSMSAFQNLQDLDPFQNGRRAATHVDRVKQDPGWRDQIHLLHQRRQKGIQFLKLSH